MLCGLVTVKDVLKYTLTETGESRAVRWDDAQFLGFIEDAWTWVTSVAGAIGGQCRRLIRR